MLMFNWYTQKNKIINCNQNKKATASEKLKSEDIWTGHSITKYETEKLAYVFGIKLF